MKLNQVDEKLSRIAFILDEMGADLIDGGLGKDTVSYFYQNSIAIAIDNSILAAGAAVGDKYQSIEVVVGSNAGDDVIRGDEGANEFHGEGGADYLAGNGGDDILAGGEGADTFDGGSGSDTASYKFANAVIVDLLGIQIFGGSAVDDIFISIENLEGSETGLDQLLGGIGTNIIRGLGGDDFLDGRKGADRLEGGNGDDVLVGGPGADQLLGGSGFDIADYSNGNPVTVELDNSKKNTGAALGDTFRSIEGLGGSNTGDDTLIGNKKSNFLLGNGGKDSLFGQSGDDYLDGGLGADTLFGGKGFDYADYSSSKSGITVSLDGSLTGKRAAKGDTFDSIEGIFGSASNDKLSGDARKNELHGNGGDDKIFGRAGDDLMFGDFGSDTIDAGSGYDILIGGNGIDRLDGGGEVDVYAFDRPQDGWDTIAKFEKDEEVAFSKEGFGLDVLGTKIFQSRNDNQAQDADDRFIYEKDARALWFDSDGIRCGRTHKNSCPRQRLRSQMV